MPRYWIVVCPEYLMLTGSLWARWYKENCVTIGWKPPEDTLDGPTDDKGWSDARKRLKQVQVGDRVIPFPLKWRIGPVGTVTAIKVADEEWNPIMQPEETRENGSGLGRRILVKWEQAGMPPNGMVATVPKDKRGNAALAHVTIKELPPDQFQKLCSILSEQSNWIDIAAGKAEEVAEPPDDTEPSVVEQLNLLERDLQGFLSRNLSAIEPGLKQHAEYDLEQHQTGVGYIDLLALS